MSTKVKPHRPDVIPLGDSSIPAMLPSETIDLFSGDPNFMTSLARGLAVIQAFSHAKSFLTISQLSLSTGLSRAAVRRCLYTLTKLGLAVSEDGRHFSLRPRILTLGHSYISSLPLAKLAQPILDRLSQTLRESCSIAMLDGSDVIHVAHSNVTRILAIDLSMGSRLPAVYTSLGRVMLASLSPEDLEAHLSRAELTAHTPRTITNPAELRQAIQFVRTNGYALVDQELEIGLRALAVPIRNSAGKPFAALNVGAHAQRVSVQDMVGTFLPYLQRAGEEISGLLR